MGKPNNERQRCFSKLKNRWHTTVNRVWLRFLVSLQQSTIYGRPNMFYFAVLELGGQPLYYFIWHYAYPQAYESIGLRAACVIIAVPMLFEPQITRQPKLDKWLTLYWVFLLLFELPFFFFFMLLMNDLSATWALSTLAALMILVILVFDWLMALLLTMAGALSACLVFWAVGGELSASQQIPLPVVLATYLFGIIVGSAVNYKAELVAQEKMAAITDALGTVAHEMRTPLLGIRSGARGLSSYLPAIIEGYELAKARGLPIQSIRRAHFQQIKSVPERIQIESEYTSAVLDMLLINSNRASIDRSAFEKISIAGCVHRAIERYPFASSRQCDWIHYSDIEDFDFHGSQLLMVHVLFNLLKNAIYQLARNGAGDIRIWTSQDQSQGIHRLHFKDTGPGIAPDVRPRIFERFYSGMPRGQGTGIGLAFVKLVIDSFGGHIRCDSVLGEYTEFTMTFPAFDTDDH